MNQADTAWMLISTALVLLMTPALAFFYGGLVRSKNALNTMMMSFVSLGFVGVLWAVIGYSLAFGAGSNWIGDTSLGLFLHGVGLEPKEATTIPHYLFMCYQGTFAIITAALISGAIVERMRFSAYVVFICLWALVVYSPVAHWVWGGGWLADMGALDFAGGTVVHVNAGVAALVAALVVGKRRDYPGSAPAAAQRAVHAARRRDAVVRVVRLQRRQRARARTRRRRSPSRPRCSRRPARWWSGRCSTWRGRSKPTAVGAATAIVVGLVAITPAAGFVGPMSAIALGAIAAVPSYFALIWRAKTSPRRLARRRRRARYRRHGRCAADRRLRPEGAERAGRRPAVRQSAPADDSGGRGWRGDRLQRRHELRAAQGHRPGDTAARRAPRTNRRASTSRSTAKKPTSTTAACPASP